MLATLEKYLQTKETKVDERDKWSWYRVKFYLDTI